MAEDEANIAESIAFLLERAGFDVAVVADGRKARDRSIAPLLVGVVLLMPPLIGVSLVDGAIAGLPIPLLYVFAVWAALIAGAAALARPLQNSETVTFTEDIPALDVGSERASRGGLCRAAMRATRAGRGSGTRCGGLGLGEGHQRIQIRSLANHGSPMPPALTRTSQLPAWGNATGAP